MSRTNGQPDPSSNAAVTRRDQAEVSARSKAPDNVLILQSAHPEFVLRTLERLREHPVCASPHYSILCSDRTDILSCFQNHPMISEIHAHSGARTAWKMLLRLRREKYSRLLLFFTGEPGYWKTKWFAFLITAERKIVVNENGDQFDLTLRSAVAYYRHRLQTKPMKAAPDFAARFRNVLGRMRRRAYRVGLQDTPVQHQGERILILQSADPDNVLHALDRLRKTPLFSNPRYTVFCRALPEVVAKFRDHPMIDETCCHSETRGSWNHLRHLRRERYDAVVLLLTGEPGYWKIKCFGFLLGTRHRVIFNENNDCFYFTWKAWSRLLAHRLAAQPGAPAESQVVSRAAGHALFLIKFLVFPFRFAWLLVVWLRLRRSAMRTAG